MDALDKARLRRLPDALLLSGAGALLASLLRTPPSPTTTTTTTATPSPRNAVLDMTLLRFDAPQPLASTLPQLLEHVIGNQLCSRECAVVATALLFRLLRVVPAVGLTLHNIHRFVVIAMMVASKVIDDRYCRNTFYAMLAGLPIGQLNRLELDFCFLLRFDLHVTLDEYSGVCDRLVEAVGRRSAQFVDRPFATAPASPLLLLSPVSPYQTPSEMDMSSLSGSGSSSSFSSPASHSMYAAGHSRSGVSLMVADNLVTNLNAQWSGTNPHTSRLSTVTQLHPHMPPMSGANYYYHQHQPHQPHQYHQQQHNYPTTAPTTNTSNNYYAPPPQPTHYLPAPSTGPTLLPAPQPGCMSYYAPGPPLCGQSMFPHANISTFHHPPPSSSSELPPALMPLLAAPYPSLAVPVSATPLAAPVLYPHVPLQHAQRLAPLPPATYASKAAARPYTTSNNHNNNNNMLHAPQSLLPVLPPLANHLQQYAPVSLPPMLTTLSASAAASSAPGPASVYDPLGAASAWYGAAAMMAARPPATLWPSLPVA